MRPYRCVKCAQGHRTIDCPKKDRNTPATCTLCFGSHPANYRGCQVYKEIRARKIMQQGSKTDPMVKKTSTKTFPQLPLPRLDDFPPLRQNNYVRSDPTCNEIDTPQNPPMPNSWNTGNRDRKIENTLSQSTNLLEQIIAKQSEKINILIQQIGTLMGLLTNLITQCPPNLK